MYIPEHFQLKDHSAAMALIQSFPFATVVAHASPPLIANVPIIAIGDGPVFEGHVARANPMADHVLAGAMVTAAFLGPHAYVSPTWYASRGLVPTWNFAAVHLTGRLEPVTDTDALALLVENLADHFERDSDNPWIPDYAPSMLDAIVGFQIHVEHFEIKYKLSQNRSTADRIGVIDALNAGGPESRALAALMRRYA
jgi:transcriptional regulator